MGSRNWHTREVYLSTEVLKDTVYFKIIQKKITYPYFYEFSEMRMGAKMRQAQLTFYRLKMAFKVAC